MDAQIGQLLNGYSREWNRKIDATLIYIFFYLIRGQSQEMICLAYV